MIKNVIFDIGNVLTSFQPQEFLKDFFKDEQIAKDLYRLFFESDLWNLYDQGIYDSNKLKEKAISILPEYAKQIDQMIPTWVQYLIPFESSLELVHSLKEDGYKTYVLSNIPEDCYLHLVQDFDLFKEMDGGIYSYQDHLIKPDPKIFQLLLDRYELKGEECLFIDDRLENIKAASAFGIRGLLCKDAKELPRLVRDELK